MRFLTLSLIIPVISADKKWIVVGKDGSCDEILNRVAFSVSSTPTVLTVDQFAQNVGCLATLWGSDETAQQIERVDGVEAVSEDQEVQAEYTYTWGLDRIDQEELPLSKTRFKTPYTGLGQDIYILDTGVYPDHVELKGRVQTGKDLINEKPKTDNHGHGTHCAGTAAGAKVGAAPEATIIPVKVLNARGVGSISGVIKGIDWCLGNAGNKPSVFSLSLGSSKNQVLDRTIRAAGQAGHIVVSAAGNKGSDACNYSPARSGGDAVATGVFTVGATTSRDQTAYYTNWGRCVDIFAPGSSITSAGHRRENEYTVKSGTSMATPHVAGVAATMLEKHKGNKNAAIVEIFEIATNDAIVGVPSSTPNVFLRAVIETTSTRSPTNQPTRFPTKQPVPTAPTSPIACPGFCAVVFKLRV